MDINSHIDNITVKTFADIINACRSIILKAKENNIEITDKHYTRFEKHLFNLNVFNHDNDEPKMHLIMTTLRSHFSNLQQSIGFAGTTVEYKKIEIKVKVHTKSTNDFIDPDSSITTPEELVGIGIVIPDEMGEEESPPQWLIDMRKKAEGIE